MARERREARIVSTSAEIADADEACAYYHAHFALDRAHRVIFKTGDVYIIFPGDGIHAYTRDISEDELPPIWNDIVGTQTETRVLDFDRARRLDDILPAIQNHALVMTGRKDRVVLYGPQLDHEGRRLQVVLRPFGRRRWVCVTAFTIEAWAFRQLKPTRMRFPA